MDCKNCGLALEEKTNFCLDCGAKVIRNRVTIKSITRQINEEFLSIDSKLIATFWHLLTKPEVVIGGYIDGVRKRYVNVISYLAISLTIFGFQLFVVKKFFSEQFPTSQNPNIEAELQKKISEWMTVFFDYSGLISILFLPILSLITYIMFHYKNKHNYAEHIILNSYIIAQYTILTVVLGTPLLFIIDLQLSYMIIMFVSYLYNGYCLKKIYDLSVLGAIWRTVIIILIYMIIFFVAFLVLAILLGIYLAVTGKIPIDTGTI